MMLLIITFFNKLSCFWFILNKVLTFFWQSVLVLNDFAKVFCFATISFIDAISFVFVNIILLPGECIINKYLIYTYAILLDNN